MPFELGIDYGCKQFDQKCVDKKVLILDEKKYRYQAALSDMAGCDIKAHNAEYSKAVTHVRNWLVLQANAKQHGPNIILGKWVDFQEWYWEKQTELGASEEDIREYPTSEMLASMKEWIKLFPT